MKPKMWYDSAHKFILKTSIRYRLLMYFFILMTIPIVIISLALYTRSKSIINENIKISVENNLNTISSNFVTKINSIDTITTILYKNPEFVKILSAEERPNNKTDLVNEIAGLDRILQGYKESSADSLLIYPRLYMYNRPEYLQYSFSDKVTDISVLDNVEWYRKLPTKTKYSLVGYDSSQNTLKFAKRLFALKNPDLPFAGILTVDIGINDFNNILSTYKLSEKTSTLIIDTSGNVNVSSDSSLLGKNISTEMYISRIINSENAGYSYFTDKIGKETMLISYMTIPSINWIIISILPINSLNENLINFNQLLILVLIVCFLLGVPTALMLSENVSNPILKLARSMSLVRDGNFEIKLVYKRNDEFKLLIDSYKNMLFEIKELIGKLYISEDKKREAELKALQAQINPHFLYNTLDSINWMAIRKDSPEISMMVNSLSNFFRYSLSKGRSIITLQDETKQLESYLTIQKMRFGEKMEYSIDIPYELIDFLTVKLTLQPIVENSIIHGIEKSKSKGYIEIKAKKVINSIEISISDDGVGTDVEQLNAMLDEERNNSSSYGIKNVNDRIKYYFGQEFGLKYFKNEGTGITAVIKIPAILSLEGYNAKNNYC